MQLEPEKVILIEIKQTWIYNKSTKHTRKENGTTKEEYTN